MWWWSKSDARFETREDGSVPRQRLEGVPIAADARAVMGRFQSAARPAQLIAVILVQQAATGSCGRFGCFGVIVEIRRAAGIALNKCHCFAFPVEAAAPCATPLRNLFLRTLFFRCLLANDTDGQSAIRQMGEPDGGGSPVAFPRMGEPLRGVDAGGTRGARLRVIWQKKPPATTRWAAVSIRCAI
jgi:hypothetical protein